MEFYSLVDWMLDRITLIFRVVKGKVLRDYRSWLDYLRWLAGVVGWNEFQGVG